VLYCSFGKSTSGRDLWLMEFGPEQGDYVPEVLLVGGLHGDEGVGYEMSLQLSRHLCTSAGKDYLVKNVCGFYFCMFFKTIKKKL